MALAFVSCDKDWNDINPRKVQLTNVNLEKLSLLRCSLFINQFQLFPVETARFHFILLPLYDCVRVRAYDAYTHIRISNKKTA